MIEVFVYTRAGLLERGRDYIISYRQDGSDAHDGSLRGRWAGEVDTGGRLAIERPRAEPMYLMPREIQMLEEV